MSIYGGPVAVLLAQEGQWWFRYELARQAWSEEVPDAEKYMDAAGRVMHIFGACATELRRKHDVLSRKRAWLDPLMKGGDRDE